MRCQWIAFVALVSSLSISACATTSGGAAGGADAGEEAIVRAVVEGFGKRLQAVSLLSPNAAEDIREQYSSFVSPGLLQGWVADPSTAPGRLVSSPWPDRIEVTGLTKKGDGSYVVTGELVELTSVEVGNGGAAARTPVQIEVQRFEGQWLITGYEQQ